MIPFSEVFSILFAFALGWVAGNYNGYSKRGRGANALFGLLKPKVKK